LDSALRLARSARLPEVSLKHLLAAVLDHMTEHGDTLLGSESAGWQSLRALLDPEPSVADRGHASAEIDLDTPLPAWSASVKKAIARAQEIAVTFSRWEDVQTTELLIAILESPGELASLLRSQPLAIDSLVARFHTARQPAPIELPDELDWKSAGHPDMTDVYQVLDANLNRAREGIRLAEEYFRFAVGDGPTTRLWKEARQELALMASLLGDRLLLAARDTTSDVGTELHSRGEMVRETTEQVARVNSKRAQEALRAIEEFAKIVDTRVSQAAKSLRYRLYQIERQAFLAHDAHARLQQAQLYWLCDPSRCQRELAWMVREAIAGGVDVIQLRDKRSNDRELLRLAHQLREWTAKANVLFIMNDRPDLARLSRADGVHVGQEELPVREARRIVGPDALIGLSTHSIEQARQGAEQSPHYLGVGPVFASETKSFEHWVGTSLLADVAREISLPWFAIGGIDLHNVEKVVDAGARRIAVGHVLCQAEDPGRVASLLREALSKPSSIG
jgi:thiamine-phosphate pyrophosphorylase